MSAADRARLATELRKLRLATGLSTTELAARLGWSQSKVSKTELGRSVPPHQDVLAWAGATDAPAELSDMLSALAEATAVEVTEWRRVLAPGRRRKQDEIRELERSASVIRTFAPRVVIGLLQTAQYADAVFRMGRNAGRPTEDRAEVVRARLDRQVVLDDHSKRFHLIMGEAALRRHLISREGMREQFERLTKASSRPNVRLGVIPFGARERVHQYHGYAILGDPDLDDSAIVLAETVTRGLTIRAEAEVREYIAHFESLASAALFDDELRSFLPNLVIAYNADSD